jgi:hypothetical protein
MPRVGECVVEVVYVFAQFTTLAKHKTQQYLKDRTNDHFYDVWKVVETGEKKFGPKWKGSGGYARADVFAKHFAQALLRLQHQQQSSQTETQNNCHTNNYLAGRQHFFCKNGENFAVQDLHD